MYTALIELALQNLLFFGLHMENKTSFPKQLSRKEEEECIKEIAAGNPTARNKLIEHNLRLVAYIVKKHYSEAKDQDDLISIGTIGLIRATETFDFEKGTHFSTYASKCIENQIKMFFRKTKRQQTEVFLNEPIDHDKDGNAITIADIFSDDTDIAEEVDIKLSTQMLYKYINEVLNEREKLIICKRYGLMQNDGTAGKPLAQREVAKMLGISRSYISRIEKKALQKLRGKFDKKV